MKKTQYRNAIVAKTKSMKVPNIRNSMTVPLAKSYEDHHEQSDDSDSINSPRKDEQNNDLNSVISDCPDVKIVTYDERKYVMFDKTE